MALKRLVLVVLPPVGLGRRREEEGEAEPRETLHNCLCDERHGRVPRLYSESACYLQVGQLCEGFVASRVHTFIRPVSSVDPAKRQT